MFKSLKAWINLPFKFKPYLKRDGTGAKQFKDPVDSKCYAEGKVVVVTNRDGKEVVSNKQLYVDGTLEINEMDNVIFEGRETDVKAIGYFYDKGRTDIKVVYL